MFGNDSRVEVTDSCSGIEVGAAGIAGLDTYHFGAYSRGRGYSGREVCPLFVGTVLQTKAVLLGMAERVG